jgi:hypothetical protein
MVPYETKLLLKELIDEVRCLTLSELNHRMENFDYGYMNHKNKPTTITRETLNGLNDTKLKQTGINLFFIHYWELPQQLNV